MARSKRSGRAVAAGCMVVLLVVFSLYFSLGRPVSSKLNAEVSDKFSTAIPESQKHFQQNISEFTDVADRLAEHLLAGGLLRLAVLLHDLE